jgi:hypothetical protein
VADTPSQRSDSCADTEPDRILYEERRSAQRWPLVVTGVLGAGLIVGGVVLALVFQNPVFVLASPVGFFFSLATKGNQYFLHRRTGIRISTKRLTIGAVGLADDSEPDPSQPPRTAVLMGRLAFSCAWEDVRSLTIVTDPSAIRAMREDSGNMGSPASYDVIASITRKLGMIVPPYAKAVLVVHMSLGSGRFPRIANGKRITNLQSPTWVVPTRRPDELCQVLASFPATARFNVVVPPTSEQPL